MDASARTESRAEQVLLRLAVPAPHGFDNIHRGLRSPFPLVSFHCLVRFLYSWQQNRRKNTQKKDIMRCGDAVGPETDDITLQTGFRDLVVPPHTVTEMLTHSEPMIMVPLAAFRTNRQLPFPAGEHHPGHGVVAVIQVDGRSAAILTPLVPCNGHFVGIGFQTVADILVVVKAFQKIFYKLGLAQVGNLNFRAIAHDVAGDGAR